MFTTWAMFGFKHSMTYITLPTTLVYGMSLLLSSSSLVYRHRSIESIKCDTWEKKWETTSKKYFLWFKYKIFLLLLHIISIPSIFLTSLKYTYRTCFIKAFIILLVIWHYTLYPQHLIHSSLKYTFRVEFKFSFTHMDISRITKYIYIS